MQRVTQVVDQRLHIGMPHRPFRVAVRLVEDVKDYLWMTVPSRSNMRPESVSTTVRSRDRARGSRSLLSGAINDDCQTKVNTVPNNLINLGLVSSVELVTMWPNHQLLLDLQAHGVCAEVLFGREHQMLDLLSRQEGGPHRKTYPATQMLTGP